MIIPVSTGRRRLRSNLTLRENRGGICRRQIKLVSFTHQQELCSCHRHTASAMLAEASAAASLLLCNRTARWLRLCLSLDGFDWLDPSY